MNNIEEMAYLHIIEQLKQENKGLRNEVIGLRKILTNKILTT
jgi:hypothetical protein